MCKLGKSQANGTMVPAWTPLQGWGFVESNGQDVFLHKGDLKGICVDKGTNVQFTMKSFLRLGTPAFVVLCCFMYVFLLFWVFPDTPGYCFSAVSKCSPMHSFGLALFFLAFGRLET